LKRAPIQRSEHDAPAFGADVDGQVPCHRAASYKMGSGLELTYDVVQVPR
jgi:hypothetical protein